MTSTHSASQLLRRSAYSAPSGPGDLPFPGAHRRPRGDAPADKRWGRHSAPSSGEKKNPAASLAPKVPRERQAEKGAPQPPQRRRFLGFRQTHVCNRWGRSGLGVSPVPGAARAAGVKAGARAAAHDTGGAGQVPPLTGLQQTVMTTEASGWGGGSMQGGDSSLPWSREREGRLSQVFYKDRQRTGGGGGDCRWMLQSVALSSRSAPRAAPAGFLTPLGGGGLLRKPGPLGGPALRIRTMPVLFLSGK